MRTATLLVCLLIACCQRQTLPTAQDAKAAAFAAFLRQGWGASPVEAAVPVAEVARLQGRRRALSKVFPGSALVIPAGVAKYRVNDMPYRFRPGSDFHYLTGAEEAGSVLVMLPRLGGHEDILFVLPIAITGLVDYV